MVATVITNGMVFSFSCPDTLLRYRLRNKMCVEDLIEDLWDVLEKLA